MSHPHHCVYREALRGLICDPHPCQAKTSLVFVITCPDGTKLTGVQKMLIKVGKIYTVAVEGRDVAGNPTAVDAIKSLTVSDTANFTAGVDANGVATVQATGAIVADESVSLQAVVDVLPGAAEVDVVGELLIGSIPGDAVTVALSLSEQPAP